MCVLGENLEVPKEILGSNHRDLQHIKFGISELALIALQQKHSIATLAQNFLKTGSVPIFDERVFEDFGRQIPIDVVIAANYFDSFLRAIIINGGNPEVDCPLLPLLHHLHHIVVRVVAVSLLFLAVIIAATNVQDPRFERVQKGLIPTSKIFDKLFLFFVKCCFITFKQFRIVFKERFNIRFVYSFIK